MRMISISKLLSSLSFAEKLDISIRFENLTEKTKTCWEWKGYKGKTGYGKFRIQGIYFRASRISYELFKGQIPENLTIDHLCRNRSCVNPNHLQAVSQEENTLRSNNQAAINARKTHCKNGHPLDGKNLMMRNGDQRNCRICVNRRQQKQYLRRKARQNSIRSEIKINHKTGEEDGT